MTKLRPLRENDLETVARLHVDPEATGEYGFFGWGRVPALTSGYAENGLLRDDGGLLGIEDQDTLVGMVSWFRKDATPSGLVWEIGVGLLPEARGRGLGTEAHRMLTAYLFAHTTVYRIEAVTEVGNRPEQRALLSSGFTREGVLRGNVWRDGQWRDSAIFSRLRTDN